jgi:hypothetical protein
MVSMCGQYGFIDKKTSRSSLQEGGDAFSQELRLFTLK